ncbi:MAG: zinc metalloprotease, partial [Planctomycetota bacterium]
MTRGVLPVVALLLGGCAGTPDTTTSPGTFGMASLRALADRSSIDADPDTVDLVIAADTAFLDFHGRNSARVLEDAVATLDRVLGAETGRRFRIGRATLFPSTPGVRDDLRLLWEARLRVPRGSADIVVAFTGQDCGPRAGVAEPHHRLVLCAEPSDPERSLLHEVSHLFGTRDHGRGHPGYDVPSVMSYNSDLPRTLAFDSVNASRLAARGGRLPAVQDDGVTDALRRRMEALGGGAPAAMLGSFLCAESRRSQKSGLAAAEILLETLPDDPVAAWIYGECLR